MTRLTMATALTVAALAVPAWAQAPAGHDHSHPADSEKSAPATPAPAPSPSAAAPQGGTGMMGGGMGNMPMMNDMKNMMSSMSAMHSMGMMHMMGMMGRGTDGVATIDRVEGRIAFLRAELKITDAQADAWNGFADALRTNAKKLAEVRATKPGDGQPATTLTARLDQQEQWLGARLDGTKAMKSAFVKLNEVLSDEQKKTANDLLAPHMGMDAMAMMPAQTSPEQKEQGRMPGMGMGSMGMGKK
ncbi:MAG TPA: Spy/CpxP family protein refolding chaperone [Bradyrhizobium sp.]|nr:Spy/CpxP family protein refolding chaperone [Bradyrhizobium sp.]